MKLLEVALTLDLPYVDVIHVLLSLSLLYSLTMAWTWLKHVAVFFHT
jgi:hypothetical protein